MCICDGIIEMTNCRLPEMEWKRLCKVLVLGQGSLFSKILSVANLQHVSWVLVLCTAGAGYSQVLFHKGFSNFLQTFHTDMVGLKRIESSHVPATIMEKFVTKGPDPLL
jgi:hypothetical protein